MVSYVCGDLSQRAVTGSEGVAEGGITAIDAALYILEEVEVDVNSLISHFLPYFSFTILRPDRVVIHYMGGMERLVPRPLL